MNGWRSTGLAFINWPMAGATRRDRAWNSGPSLARRSSMMIADSFSVRSLVEPAKATRVASPRGPGASAGGRAVGDGVTAA